MNRGILRGHRRRFFACRGPTLGFKPKSTLIGPLDSAVPKQLSNDAVATLRESLSNVVRNAEADAGEMCYLGWT
jgi:hypothetical protein